MQNSGPNWGAGAAAILILAAAGPPCLGQEKAVSLGGQVYSGFFSTTNRNGVENRLNFLPVGADLDLSGYLGTPGFLDYRVQPKLTSGPQSTEAGFFGGNGVTLSTTFLGRRPYPLTLNYTNLRRENVYFGGLTQVSGFRSLNHERNFGLNWALRLPRLPEISLDFNTSDLKATPDVPLLPEYRSKNRNAGLQMNDQVGGWEITSEVRRMTFSNTFAAPPDLRLVKLDQKNSVAQATAARRLWADSRLTLNGGATKYGTTFFDRALDQSYHFGNATLGFGEGSRWQGSLRSGYTSNLIGEEVQRLLSHPGSGPGAIGPDTVILFPLSARISHLSNSGNTRYEFLRGWNVFGSVSHDRVRAPSSNLTAPNSDYLTGTGGMSFTHRFSWLTLGGQYGRTLGRSTYRDLKGRLGGQNFSVVAQSGRVERLELTATYSQYDQRMEQVIQTRGGGKSAEITLGRRVERLGVRLEGGAGYDRSFFRDGGQRYRAEGLSFHTAIQHRLAQASYAHRTTDGTSLLGFLAGPLQSPLLLGTPLASVLSAFRTQTLSIHSAPLRKLEFDLLWVRSRQAYNDKLTNRFEQLDMHAGYRFRLLKFELGYVIYDQTLLGILPFYRDRFYVRVSRDFRIL